MKWSYHLKKIFYFFLIGLGNIACVSRNETKEILTLSTGSYVGVVRQIDFNKKIITVRLKGKTNFSVPFDDSTLVLRNNKPMPIKRLRFWQGVEMRILNDGNRSRLSVIIVKE